MKNIISDILQTQAPVNILIGNISDLRRCAAETIITEYWRSGMKSIYVRRWYNDMTPEKCEEIFRPQCGRPPYNFIELETQLSYNDVKYISNEWFLFNHKTGSKSFTPFAYRYPLSLNWARTAADLLNDIVDTDIGAVYFDGFDAKRQDYIYMEPLLFQYLVDIIKAKCPHAVLIMFSDNYNKNCPYYRFFGVPDLSPTNGIKTYSCEYIDDTAAVSVFFDGGAVK